MILDSLSFKCLKYLRDFDNENFQYTLKFLKIFKPKITLNPKIHP